MRNRSRIILLAILVALLAAGFLARVYLLPSIFRSRVAAELARAGFPDARFQVKSTGLFAARCEQIVLGDDLTVDAVDVKYSPASLIGGRVESVELKGLTVRATVSEGKIGFGSADRLLSPTAGAGDEPDRTKPPNFPLDLLEWENCRLLLDPSDGSDAVELVSRGNAQFRSDGSIVVRLTARDTAAGSIDGSMLRTGGGGVRFRVRSDAISARTLARLSQAYGGNARVDAGGTLALEAEGSFGDALPHIAGTLSPAVQAQIVSADPTDLATTNLSASGGVFQFDMVLSRDNPVWNLSVDKLDVRVGDASLEGISGAIEIDRWPVGSTWLSDFRATRISFGKMDFNDALVSFAIENPRRLAVRRMRVGWLDGSVELSGAFIDPLAPKLKTTVDVRNLNAEKLVELLADPYATTTGKVSGKVDIELDWPEVRIGVGRLEVAGGGRLQFKDKKMLARLLGQEGSDPSSPESQQRRAAIDALNDFEFEQMSAEMVEGPSGHVTRLVLRGRGRTGTRQALDLQLNITGVNDALYYGLILGRQLP